MRQIIVCVALALVACGGSSDTAAPTDAVSAAAGVYVLTQFKGVPLGPLTDAAGDVVTLSDTLTLRADHSYSDITSAVFRHPDGTVENDPPETEAGAFDVVGTQITFTVHPADGSPVFSYTGAIAAGKVSYTRENVEYGYTKL